MRLLALLVVSALFAGCVAPDANVEDTTTPPEPDVLRVPTIAVDVVDSEGNPTYTAPYEGELTFVPRLVDGTLDDVQDIVMRSEETDITLTADLFEDGELVPATPRNLGVPGGHFWHLGIQLSDGNWTDGEYGFLDTGVGPRFWIAVEQELEPLMLNFTSGPLPGDGLGCGGPGGTFLLPPENRWAWRDLEVGGFYNWAGTNGVPNPVDDATIQATLHIEGDAVPIRCDESHQNATTPEFTDNGDGTWSVTLTADDLVRSFRGTYGATLHVQFYSQSPDNQVTVTPSVRYPAGPV